MGDYNNIETISMFELMAYACRKDENKQNNKCYEAWLTTSEIRNLYDKVTTVVTPNTVDLDMLDLKCTIA